jgi:hypothetical protein
MQQRNAKTTLRKKRYGRCRICQKFGRLTKEHVPPQGAFNDSGYLEFYIDRVNEAELVRWEARDVNTKGIYLFTLCEKCNNQTGSLYGRDYGKFVEAFTSVATPDNAGEMVKADLKDFFPVRVVKQVVSMMLSTSEPCSSNGYEAFRNPFLDADVSIPLAFSLDPPASLHLETIYDELRRFVTDKEAKSLPSGVRLYAYAVANDGAALRTGIAVHGKLKTQKVYWLAVVGLWPIHWVLLLHGDSLGDEVADFTDWANFGFKAKKIKQFRSLVNGQWGDIRWISGRPKNSIEIISLA